MKKGEKKRIRRRVNFRSFMEDYLFKVKCLKFKVKLFKVINYYRHFFIRSIYTEFIEVQVITSSTPLNPP